jgi:hypothetical protein
VHNNALQNIPNIFLYTAFSLHPLCLYNVIIVYDTDKNELWPKLKRTLLLVNTAENRKCSTTFSEMCHTNYEKDLFKITGFSDFVHRPDSN